MDSPQALSEADRRAAAGWAADCAEHVLAIFETSVPGDTRPRDLIARARAFAAGELGTAEAIRRRFKGGVPASEVREPAAAAAARSAGQAAAVAHMGAHALGAAAYAAQAADLATHDGTDAAGEELRWQLARLPAAVRAALHHLPPVGQNASGPLGPGLLATGIVGERVRQLQASLGPPERSQDVGSSAPKRAR